MEREGDCLVPDTAPPNGELDIEESVLSSNFVLDHVGEVVLTLNSDGLSWKWVESMYNVSFTDYIRYIYCYFHQQNMNLFL